VNGIVIRCRCQDEEVALIKKIHLMMMDLFPPGNRSNAWPSLVALKEDINKRVGDRFGFKVSTNGSSVACTCRAAAKGYINHQVKRSAVVPGHKRRNRKTSKIGCIFIARAGHVSNVARILFINLVQV